MHFKTSAIAYKVGLRYVGYEGGELRATFSELSHAMIYANNHVLDYDTRFELVVCRKDDTEIGIVPCVGVL